MEIIKKIEYWYYLHDKFFNLIIIRIIHFSINSKIILLNKCLLSIKK